VDPISPGYTDTKSAQLRRLRRIDGQIRGLQRMVEDEKYCIDVLTQVSAATRALESFALGLLEEHLGHCVAEAVAHGGRDAEEKVKGVSDAVARLVRS
jgi:CsoR family transcriptional regulator, copper-sensing transcriptional repressor